MPPLLLHTSRCLAGTAYSPDARDKKGVVKVRSELTFLQGSRPASLQYDCGSLAKSACPVSIKIAVATSQCRTPPRAVLLLLLPSKRNPDILNLL
jgi:hypothetical protein